MEGGQAPWTEAINFNQPSLRLAPRSPPAGLGAGSAPGLGQAAAQHCAYPA